VRNFSVFRLFLAFLGAVLVISFARFVQIRGRVRISGRGAERLESEVRIEKRDEILVGP
jgi:hypothetical protein